MKTTEQPHVILVVAVVLLVAWIARNTEWGEVEVPTPLRGDAATNPFYAAQQLVETLGATSERRESLGDDEHRCRHRALDVGLGHQPRAARGARALGRSRRQARRRCRADHRHRCVRAVERHRARARRARSGGSRICSRRPRSSSRVRRSTRSATQRASGCRRWTPASTEVLQLRLRRAGSQTDAPLLWALERRGLSSWPRAWPSVQGSVTVVNGVPFVYRELFEGEHGELLVAAATLARRRSRRVHDGGRRELAARARVAARCAGRRRLLLFIALALWRGAMRFGPLVAPAERARRSLAEQILRHGPLRGARRRRRGARRRRAARAARGGVAAHRGLRALAGR